MPGYQDHDGTMVVVDNAKKRISQTFDVLITSVLQTQAGRMIFAKPASEESGNDRPQKEQKNEGREHRQGGRRNKSGHGARR